MILETERLVLREYQASDFEVMFALDRDAAVQQMRGRAILSLEQSRRNFEGMLRSQDEQPRIRYAFIVERHDDLSVIGRSRLQVTNAHLGEGEIAYHFFPHAWGQGYATETARELLRFGFQDLKLHRIVGKCYVENKGSIHVLEKIGMQLEGRRRQNRWFNGIRRDTLVYSILNPEWQGES